MDISIRIGGRMEVGARVKYLEKIKKTRLRDGHACWKSWLDAMSIYLTTLPVINSISR